MNQSLEQLREALTGRYDVKRAVGAGGMATVYLAEDTRHGRDVAIKVLRPEVGAAVGRDRFLQEIQLAAQLQHPNILPLIDSGEVHGLLYYIMPFIAGESLRQWLARERALTVAECMRLTGEIADGLELAHRRGVNHRDIKPENILLQERHALIGDFGIARAIREAGDERLTEPGLSLGTPAYMSPEQIDGAHDIDRRSDIYGVGCVMFEMLSGAPPFRASTAHAVLMKQLTEVPPEIRGAKEICPRQLAAIVSKALAKDPRDRFQTAAELSEALRHVSTEHKPLPWSVGRKPTVVVIPFENTSPSTDDAFFSIGLTDEVISDLSKVKALQVISRNSSMTLRGTTKDLRTIGRELGVCYAVTGSVRRAGNALRITAQLVDTITDTLVWADKYSGTVADMFDLQETLARQIVGALRLTITPEESQRLAARSVANVVIFEKISRARDLLYSYDPSALQGARTLLYEALATAGDDATVLGWLATVHCWMLLTGSAIGEGTLAMADGFAQRAIALAPDNAQAHWAKSEVEFTRAGPRAAAPWGRNAVRLERSAESLGFLSYFLGLAGTTDEALALADESIQRDPLNPSLRWWRSWTLLTSGNTQRAAEEALQLAGGDYLMGTWSAGITLMYCGRQAEALALLGQVPTGKDAPLLFEFAQIIRDAMGGSRPKSPDPSLALIEWTQTGDPFGCAVLASMYAYVGDRSRSLHWIEFAIGRGMTHDLWWDERDPFMVPLRNDASFRTLMNLARSMREGQRV